jgi:hypothetical protein
MSTKMATSNFFRGLFGPLSSMYQDPLAMEDGVRLSLACILDTEPRWGVLSSAYPRDTAEEEDIMLPRD